MTEDNKLEYKIAVGLIPGLGPVNAKNIIAHLGSVEKLFTCSKKELIAIPGIAEKSATQIIKNRHIEDRVYKEIEFIKKNKIKTLFYTDTEYPFFLKQCNDAPLLLYFKGNINFSGRKLISVVGTRKASAYGKDLCKEIIKELAEREHNPIIVSGLAYGVDICAHNAALDNGLETIAILGHGLNRLYPPQHRKKAIDIIQNGALITEFMSDAEFKRQNFLQRNRIIAGISQATIIIESARKGGSLTTAEYANSYNREVFALPGRIGDKYSEGCNYLIKTHRAVLLQSADDIEYLLNWEKPNRKTQQKEIFITLSKEEEKILSALKYGETTTIDKICRKTQMPVFSVSATLLDLEFKNLIRALPGKIYELTDPTNF